MTHVDTQPEFQEFRRESVDLLATDPHSAGLSGAYAELMQTNHDFAQWIADISDKRRAMGPFSPGHSVRLKRYLAQGALLEIDPDLRSGYPSQEDWARLLTDVHASPYYRGEYEISHVYLNPVTSKPTRYHTSLLLAGILAEADEQPFRHVDLGCGSNTGLALESLFMSGEFPLDSKRLPPLPKLHSGSASEKSVLRGVFQKARRRTFDESYGIDLFHPHDPLASKWGKACQLPVELIDQRRKKQRRLFTQERDSNDSIHFSLADISAPGLRGAERLDTRKVYDIQMVPGDYSADIATAFFVHYMLSPERRRQTFDNMQDTARYQLILDAITQVRKVRKDEHPIDQIEFAQQWTEWSTALVLFDRENPDKGQQLVARFRDGTCQEIRPEGPLLTLLQKVA